MIIRAFINDVQAVRILEVNGINWDMKTVTEWSSTYHNNCEPREVERLVALRNGEWIPADEVINELIINKLINKDNG